MWLCWWTNAWQMDGHIKEIMKDTWIKLINYSNGSNTSLSSLSSSLSCIMYNVTACYIWSSSKSSSSSSSHKMCHNCCSLSVAGFMLTTEPTNTLLLCTLPNSFAMDVPTGQELVWRRRLRLERLVRRRDWFSMLGAVDFLQKLLLYF